MPESHFAGFADKNRLQAPSAWSDCEHITASLICEISSVGAISPEIVEHHRSVPRALIMRDLERTVYLKRHHCCSRNEEERRTRAAPDRPDQEPSKNSTWPPPLSGRGRYCFFQNTAS